MLGTAPNNPRAAGAAGAVDNKFSSDSFYRTSSLSEDSAAAAAAGTAFRARLGVGAAASPSNGSGQAPSSSRPPSWMLTACAGGFSD